MNKNVVRMTGVGFVNAPQSESVEVPEAALPPPSSVELLKGRLGRRIVPVIWENTDTGEALRIDVKVLRAGEIMLIAKDILILTDEPPNNAEAEAQAIIDGIEEMHERVRTSPQMDSVSKMRMYATAIVAEAVVDKEIDADLISQFPMGFLIALYNAALDREVDGDSTVDNFPEVADDPGE